MNPVEAVAEAWASIDGHLDDFRAERELPSDHPRRCEEGVYYDGYIWGAKELIDGVRKRGYVLVPAREAFDTVDQ